jgi:hypothetical protein
MGKKKTVAAATPSKKERRALEAREAEIRAELERRAAAKSKKGKGGKKGKSKSKPAPVNPITPSDVSRDERRKKGKGKKSKPAPAAPPEPTIEAGALGAMTIGPEAPITPEPADAAPAEDRSTPLSGAELQAAMDADTIAGIKRKVAEKRAAREAGRIVDDEHAGRLAAAAASVAADRAKRSKKAKAEAPAVEPEAPAQVAEILETDHGREIAVGTPTSDEFAKPSEAPKADFEVNGNGQYKVKRPSDGKIVGYTRVTTYIDALEDKSRLTSWKMRVLLEGVAAAEELVGNRDSDRESVTAKIRELAHVRDVAIAKARKSDRKGKIAPGALGPIVSAAEADFRRAMDDLADELFEIGGGREAASKGTDLHSLCDLYDHEGITAVGDLLTAGQITPADLADVEAYADAMRKLGGENVEIERVVVNDDLRVAGRLDRVRMVKLPEIIDPKTGEILFAAEGRARRRVLDIKTGSVEYSIGKIAQQLEMYAGAVGYDLDTHEREDLKIDRTKAILVHLPAGMAKATVHVVDLTLGRKGNRLAGSVREFRNEGKRAARLDIDVLEAIDRSADA